MNMLKGIISEKEFKRLLLIVLSIFLFFSLVSALVIFKTSHVMLSPHYGATYTLITQVKESLVIKTIKINLFFYVLTAVGVAFLGILYSHRIAGPLFKVKKYASMLGDGKFDERICFRRKDAVHKLASTLNEVAQGCRDRTERLTAELNAIEENLLLLRSVLDKPEEKHNLIKKLRELDAGIKAAHQKIKL